MIVELGVAALILSMLGKKTPKDITVEETAQEKMDREAKEREDARVAAETSYRITADNAKTEADKKELERINAEIKKMEEDRKIEDAKYFNFLAFGRDTTDMLAYKAMQSAYQNKSVAEGKLYRTITSITDPITKTVIPAGKEFKLAVGKYKSLGVMAIPMVAFWGGRDNAIWFTYPVKDLYDVEANILTSPAEIIKDSGTETSGPTSGGKTTYDGGGIISYGPPTTTTTKGTGIGKTKSPNIGGYYGK